MRSKEKQKLYMQEYRKKAKAKEYLKTYNRSAKSRYCDMKRRCKNKNLEIDPPEVLYPLINQVCYYCNETSQGLDRIDNSKGYTADNVLSCCGRCNMTRGSFWTPEEAKAMILLGLKIRAEKSST